MKGLQAANCYLTYAQILSCSETTKGKDHLETLEILS